VIDHLESFYDGVPHGGGHRPILRSDQSHIFHIAIRKDHIHIPNESPALISEVNERRALNLGNVNSFSMLFLPKVNTAFQKCEKTL
jgi:hypothetical protein